jgi:hypothetical protein
MKKMLTNEKQCVNILFVAAKQQRKQNLKNFKKVLDKRKAL